MKIIFILFCLISMNAMARSRGSLDNMPIISGTITYAVADELEPCAKHAEQTCYRRYYIAAQEMGKTIWRTEIYNVLYNQSLEKRDQEVRVTRFKRQDGNLIATDQNKVSYKVSIKTGKLMNRAKPVAYYQKDGKWTESKKALDAIENPPRK